MQLPEAKDEMRGKCALIEDPAESESNQVRRAGRAPWRAPNCAGLGG